MAKILVLGGDGFCGWPTALHLSKQGHEVVILDNLSRRQIDDELGIQSLTPIRPIDERIAAWDELTNHKIGFRRLTVGKEFDALLEVIEEHEPEAIVHFAEQRAAPYSMKSTVHKRYTVDNNLNATHDVCAAIVESGRDIHLVHLGTMGVYGYGTAGLKIPEGYLRIKVETPEEGEVETEILYPANPGSIYHMTKTQDALFFQFYAKNDHLRITDLHQGIVWGTQTPETSLDERLINRFDYDGEYGTVLNRFLVQAAVGHPLTVHGTGGQTRAFIHIRDTVRCIERAIDEPPESGSRVEIRNQMTETHKLKDLAEMIAERTGAEIAYVENPRNEAAENELNVINEKFFGHALEPTTLEEGLMEEVRDIAARYRDRVDPAMIPATSKWTKR